MLRSIISFFGDKLTARDGSIGHCEDFLFDDRNWTARYMVANTDAWLDSRLVLISPYSLNDPDLGKHPDDIPVDLPKQEIENSPSLDSSNPVSRLHEIEMARFFKHPVYWEGEMLWGSTPFPENEEPPAPEEFDRHAAAIDAIENCHLRSAREVIGYRIEAADGEVGKVKDFIIENRSWAIRYLVVDTGGWLGGRLVLISPDWTTDIDWSEAKLTVTLERDAIERSPHYDPLTPVNRNYENELYDYYGRAVYY